MCSLRRSHDIDVVDRYSDLAISLTITGNVGGLKGYIGIGDIIGVLGTVGGVPIFGNAIGVGEVVTVRRPVPVPFQFYDY